MNGKKTGQDSDFVDLRPGAKSFLLVRGGPVIVIKAETGNIASLPRMQNEIDIVRDISDEARRGANRLHAHRLDGTERLRPAVRAPQP